MSMLFPPPFSGPAIRLPPPPRIVDARNSSLAELEIRLTAGVISSRLLRRLGSLLEELIERILKLLRRAIVLQALRLRGGQHVASLILRMSGMPLHPVPAHLVRGSDFVQTQPNVFVLYVSFPSPRLPCSNPLRDPIAQVDGISIDLDFTRLFQATESFNRRLKFHSIVSRCNLTSDDLPCHAAKL